MKRIILYLLAFAPLAAFADLPPTGFYRVQNVTTGSYMTIFDNRTSSTASDIATSGHADLEAIHMLDGFEENIAFNPATICYIEYCGKDKKGNYQYNISGQGLDLRNMTGRLFFIKEVSSSYQIYAKEETSAVNVSKYLTHPTNRYGKEPYPGIDGSNKNWNILSVDQSSSQYFGIKPEVSAAGYHWATMYAGFPFKVSSSDTKIYVVKKIDYDYGCAVIEEVTSVSAQIPVLFRCSSATPSGNKLTLLAPGSEGSKGTTHLVGNYYCNDVDDNASSAIYPHRNVTAYNENTMRMLGVDTDGKPAFVKGSADNLVVSVVDGKLYLPANKAYLKVNSSAPDVLKIMTEAEYEAYVTGIEQITTSTTDGTKVIYDLQGRRVQAPSKGLYIVNGKKMIIK